MQRTRIRWDVGIVEALRSGRCAETRAHLSEHLEGELTGRRAKRVLRHLHGCERCQAVLRSLAQAVEHLRELGRAEPSPHPSLADAVLTRVRREAAPELPT